MDVAAMSPWRLICCLLLVPLSAQAQDATVIEARRLQLDTLRAEIAGQLQLLAFDLVDELIYGWTQAPVFAAQTPLVLADVSVPVGFGSGLQALIENHFASVLLKNPRAQLVLAHCPECTSVVVRSSAKGTVVARGVDEPQALALAGSRSASRHALFLDFEVEGSHLVLRARITALTAELPIVFARTLTTSTAAPAMLRSPDQLKSAEEARSEYLNALTGRGQVTVPMRLGLRTYATRGGAAMRQIPFIWLQSGADFSLTQARAWTAGLSLGVSWAPALHTAFLAEARMSRLLTGSVSSLSRPDLYLFVGGSIITVFGAGALLFGDDVPDVNEVLQGAIGARQFSASFPGLQLGLELRMKDRIRAGVFVESLPTMGNARSIGTYLNYGLLQLHAIGAEVAFCF